MIKRLGKFWKSIRDKREVASVRREMMKLAVGVAVGICCVGVASGNGYAAYSSTTHGVHNISNPTNSGTTVDEQRTTASIYSYLYFGRTPNNSNYESSAKNKEIYWRVLNTTANDDNNTPALFVLTEYGLPTKRVWNSSSGQTYSGSVVQTFLNSTMYGECFSDKEKAAILSTSKTESGNDYIYSGVNYYCYPCSLSSQKMFLLSMKEAENSAYGFTDTRGQSSYANTTDVNRVCKQGASGGSNTEWWLRSGTSNRSSDVAYVTTGGQVNAVYSHLTQYQYAVRGALNINLSSVILTSPASGASSSSTLSSLASNAPSAAAGSTESTSNASRLTIYDSSRNNFNVFPSNISQKAGNNIKINYLGMPTTGSDYVSVLLYNSSKSIVYYGRLCTSSGSGVATMTVPSISEGTYTLRVLNEYQETDRVTSYAGYKDIQLTVTSTADTTVNTDTTAPTITNVYKNSGGTYFKLTASDSGGLGAVTNTSSTTLFREIASYGTGGTCNVETTSGTTAMRVYDKNGNYSDVNSDILTDSTPPVIDEVSYENGKYIITLTDEESGIWKLVGNNSDSTTTTLVDYST